jgi:hypothetical protein
MKRLADMLSEGHDALIPRVVRVGKDETRLVRWEQFEHLWRQVARRISMCRCQVLGIAYLSAGTPPVFVDSISISRL